MPNQLSSPGAQKLRSTVRKLVKKIKPAKEGPMPGELDSREVQLARFFGKPVSSSSSIADTTTSLATSEAMAIMTRDSGLAQGEAGPDVASRFATSGTGERDY